MIGGRKKLPDLGTTESKVRVEREPTPDSIDYWADADKWQELGRKVQADAAEERRTGVPPAGASVRLSIFRSLRKRLDRRAR